MNQFQSKTKHYWDQSNWLTKPILGEIFKEIVNDSRSARAYGSAALEIVSVATGNLEAYMTPRLQPWDFAGGLVILYESKWTSFKFTRRTINN